MDELLTGEVNKKKESSGWSKFVESEQDRILKSDPEATAEEIRKFAESKWKNMSVR